MTVPREYSEIFRECAGETEGTHFVTKMWILKTRIKHSLVYL